METVRRGYEPKDSVEFGDSAKEKLRRAAQELQFLLNRGYDIKSASTFIGNHHLLSERQRMALARITSSETGLKTREEKELKKPPEKLMIDGFNTIVTLEVALSGSLLLEGMDGTIRDLVGLRGTYRIVDKTVRAVDLLLDWLEKSGVRSALVYLDQQVSNSGRLRALLLDRASKYSVKVDVLLHPDVDRQLFDKKGVVTSDAIILDKFVSWYNLNHHLILDEIPEAWILRLSEE